MSIDQVAPAALSLPLKERALLATSLWESLEDPFLASDLDDAEALAWQSSGTERLNRVWSHHYGPHIPRRHP